MVEALAAAGVPDLLAERLGGTAWRVAVMTDPLVVPPTGGHPDRGGG